MPSTTATLTRESKALEVPQGTTTVLPKGTPVRILQSLGDAHTVITEWQQILRIAAEDSDALGVDPPRKPQSAPTDADRRSLEEQCLEGLKSCYDPEIPVNVVDLGLIYVCQVTPLAGGGSEALVLLTLTSPGCAMSDVLVRDVEEKLTAIPGVEQVQIEIVFDPPWTPDRMTEAARLELGMV